MTEVLRYSAFTTDPAGGNPAGVVLDASGLDEAAMLRIAADVGYSETAFLSARGGDAYDVRYFSPLAEVSFCGHATIATAVAHAERHGPGPLLLHTASGEVSVTVDAGLVATLTSVHPEVVALAPDDRTAILAALGWEAADLDADLGTGVAFAGAWHAILPVRPRKRLAALDYDFDALAALMAARGWTTVALVHRESAELWHARNLFPPGGVVEDPATGAAAAAFGAYLEDRDLLPPERAFTIRQGDDLGRPSTLRVEVPADPADGVAVSGRAVGIAEDDRDAV